MTNIHARFSQPLQGLAFGLLILVLAGAPLAAGLPRQSLDTVPACLHAEHRSLPLTLEVASTPQQKQIGLMGRTSLPDFHGMLFVYERERSPSAGFWMYQTLIPLDIAWLDEEHVILAMDTMEPCESRHSRDCPVYSPGVGHFHVLEMEAGFFDANHVTIGDRLELGLTDQSRCN